MNSTIRSKSVRVVHSIRDMLGKGDKKPKKYEIDDHGEFVEQRTDWRSIYIAALVALIGSIHTHIIGPALWPYMRLLIPGVTENYYGLLQSISSTGIVISGLMAGLSSNLLRNTRPPMIFGKLMAIISCGLYMMIELVDVDGRRAAFALFELTLGISIGAANIYRAHVAMASTEKDRPKAVAICSLAPSVGIFLGPLAQIGFTTLGYPGVSFILGTHINLYTSPVLLTIFISLVGVCLLIFCFDGKMRNYKASTVSISDNNSSSSLGSIVPSEQKYDKVAVFLCFYTKMLLNLVLLNHMTIGTPYCQAIFAWTSSEAVLYISICMGLVGLNLVFWNLAYIFLNLRKRISERKAILFSIFVLLASYLITYPWPFLSETIPYQKTNITSELNMHSGLPSSAAVQYEPVGCNPDFKWCATTPKVNMWLFLGSLITTLGMALPISQINLDVLFSKILGQMKQGTMQGWFIVSGEVISIIGPIALSKIYTLTGPTYIWQFEIAMIIVSIVLWLFFYKRMVGKSKRLADGMKQST
ncbi:hypothetical protein M3Y94_00188200 [Aphelenchoides besseyi]|nr:hypothetical protein M3Y94_00188200 [Aphelenchoides besseyi]KAI6236818.1 hypothetical protein M3Y95_00199000 [Aphelenchoides besseyi]